MKSFTGIIFWSILLICSALAYFLLMFLFRGMPFIDLAHLRKQDVKGKYIVYSRHKTGRQITVRIPKETSSDHLPQWV
jgi:hypothetical protein